MGVAGVPVMVGIAGALIPEILGPVDVTGVLGVTTVLLVIAGVLVLVSAF